MQLDIEDLISKTTNEGVLSLTLLIASLQQTSSTIR